MRRSHCLEGTWLWLTDADIVHGPETLRCLIAKGEGEGSLAYGIAHGQVVVRKAVLPAC